MPDPMSMDDTSSLVKFGEMTTVNRREVLVDAAATVATALIGAPAVAEALAGGIPPVMEVGPAQCVHQVSRCAGDWLAEVRMFPVDVGELGRSAADRLVDVECAHGEDSQEGE
jgi:hypothetical protein